MMTIFVRSILFALVLGLGACASTPQSESTGEFFDSSLITAKVKSRLIDDPLTSVFRIKVNTFKGIVQLSGFVNTPVEKKRAELIAYSVGGVKQVKNSLLLKNIN
jgi:osmotically-inducible protein OsmY